MTGLGFGFEKFEGSRPEWCISSMMYSKNIPFWSETLGINRNFWSETLGINRNFWSENLGINRNFWSETLGINRNFWSETLGINRNFWSETLGINRNFWSETLGINRNFWSETLGINRNFGLKLYLVHPVTAQHYLQLPLSTALLCTLIKMKCVGSRHAKVYIASTYTSSFGILLSLLCALFESNKRFFPRRPRRAF